MRDAIGGSFVLVVILVFLVFVSAYLAYNVNYMKAFRMKDRIISYYEEYNGKCEDACKNKIEDYAKSIGYDTPENFKCSGSLQKAASGLYCVYPFERQGESSAGIIDENSNGIAYYYKIETKINIHIPIVDNLLDIDVFKISGDTKTFYN